MRILFCLACCLLITPTSSAQESTQSQSARNVFVHYMPWYSSKSVTGSWGWHWTMNHFDPEKSSSDGRREAASHFYPLIDLYDSGDPDVLECHVLLMKFAGVDGVVVDWYGIDDFRDYVVIHRNTERLVHWIKKAGLRFAICYEDATIKHMRDENFLTAAEEPAEGKKVLKWLDDQWFADEAYVTLDDRPLLLVFGPQHFQKNDWRQMTAGLSRPPVLYGLPHLARNAGFDGAFAWPPVSGGREVDAATWRKKLQDIYDSTEQHALPVAFPGFHDIYQEAGLHASYGRIDHRHGKTFADTLELAWNTNARFIQIATWNDYGEGTVIEPTREFGFRYLERLQTQTLSSANSNATFDRDDLRLPVLLYQLKKRQPQTTNDTRELERAAEMLFGGKCDEARQILERVE